MDGAIFKHDLGLDITSPSAFDRAVYVIRALLIFFTVLNNVHCKNFFDVPRITYYMYY